MALLGNAMKGQSHMDLQPEFYDKELFFRLVKVALLTEETEIPCTWLLNEHAFPVLDFQDLYHNRCKDKLSKTILWSSTSMRRMDGFTARFS